MKISTRVATVGASVALLAASVLPAFAAAPMMHKPMHPMMKKQALTKEQKDTMAAAKKTYEDALKAARQQMKSDLKAAKTKQERAAAMTAYRDAVKAAKDAWMTAKKSW